ncbi:F510_1955 family glycosylhydrolase, partial [Thermobifida halotolerans]
MKYTAQKLRTPVGLAGLAAAVALSSGCTTADSGAAPSQTPGSPAAGVPLPAEAAHVHGVDVDPATGDVLVATHSGLVRVSAPDSTADGGASVERVGPAIDLMGFAVAEPGRLVASGHPGPGVDLPDPVGLVESRDGGQSWEPLSRAGESDFHALAATPDRVIGFDGRLRATEDGVTWTELDSAVEPFSLAVSDDGATVVATTPRG